MTKPMTASSLFTLNVLLALVSGTITPRPAQAVNFKKTAIKLAVCGGGAYAGVKLGEKLAALEAKKLKLDAAEAAKHRRAIQIGMAATLCGGGVYLAGTVYENLSKRDRKVRQKEMEAALADVNPSTRTYVLPDSGYQGKLVTDAPQQDGEKQCRIQVDFLAREDEPARARWCRKSPNDTYDLDL